MIFHLGTQWLTFMAILQGSESVKATCCLQQFLGNFWSKYIVSNMFGITC